MPEYEGVQGVKIIRLNSSSIDEPDDPTYPWKLEASFRPPEFMIVAFVGLFGGSEELVVRGMTREALDQMLEIEGFRHHPRLRKIIITGPEGEVEEIERTPPSDKLATTSHSSSPGPPADDPGDAPPGVVNKE